MLILAVVVFFCFCASFVLFVENLTPGTKAVPILTFGGKGTGPGQFDNASHIAIDGIGNVYVSDVGTRRVQRFDEGGKYLSEWSVEAKGKEAKNTGPEALAADLTGNVYVVWTGLILKYEGATGELLGTFAGDEFDTITRRGDDFKGIAIRPDGELWALSSVWSDDLVHLDAHGKMVARTKRAVSTVADEHFVLTSDVAIATDGLGNIYVLNFNYRQPVIFKFTSEGKFVKGFDARAGEEIVHHILNPAPVIAVDNQRRVYFADTDGIRVFDEDGRYFGMVSRSSYNDEAFGIAINSKNEIYVVADDSLVFKLAPFRTK